MCRFCLVQGDGKLQDDGGLSSPCLLSTALAIILDLEGSREEEPRFLSEFSFFGLKETSHEELTV